MLQLFGNRGRSPRFPKAVTPTKRCITDLCYVAWLLYHVIVMQSTRVATMADSVDDEVIDYEALLEGQTDNDEILLDYEALLEEPTAHSIDHDESYFSEYDNGNDDTIFSTGFPRI